MNLEARSVASTKSKPINKWKQEAEKKINSRVGASLAFIDTRRASSKSQQVAACFCVSELGVNLHTNTLRGSTTVEWSALGFVCILQVAVQRMIARDRAQIISDAIHRSTTMMGTLS